MSEQELHEEWMYRYQERLGILCGTNTPTEEEDRIARQEANEAIEILSGRLLIL